MHSAAFHNRSRIESILQSEAAECGLACLAMLASYHGHRITLAELRRRHSLSMQGTTLKTLIAVADELELTGRPLRLEMDDLSKLRTPCILHWDMSHYVVLVRVARNHIDIHDPACGRRRLTHSDVSQHFTGVALELSPTAAFRIRETVERVRLSDLWSRASGFLSSLGQILFLSAVLQIFVLLLPLVSQMIVDEVIAKGDQDLLSSIILGALLLLLAQAAVTLLRGYVQMHFSTLLTLQMRGNLLRHVLRLSPSWFEKRRLGDILSRFNSLQPIQDLLAGGLVSSIVDGALALIALTVMVVYAPALAAVAVMSLAIVVAGRLATFSWLRTLTDEGIQHQAKADGILFETIRGARTFKLFGKEAERHALWQNAYGVSINNQLRLQKIGLQGSTGLALISGAETMLIFYLGAKAILRQDMTLGMLVAFQAYRLQFGSAAHSLVEQFFKFRMIGLHLERLADAVHQDPETASGTRHAVRPLRGSIDVRQLSFRYSEKDPWVLKNINLTIHSGQSIALIGPSGGGKSTFLKLLIGLYAPGEGEVLIDELPMDAQGLRAYREQIGVVMQDDLLFAGTIGDNIAFFDSEIDQRRVEEAAALVGLHGEILSMPMGYMTLIGDMGSTLSGGQKQRIVLARALYHRPTILFLDEGTANLDVVSEHDVMRALAGLGITLVMVAHRPGAIQGVDRVFAIEAGSLKEVSPRSLQQVMP